LDRLAATVQSGLLGIASAEPYASEPSNRISRNVSIAAAFLTKHGANLPAEQGVRAITSARKW
jgi:hypothetical protein